MRTHNQVIKGTCPITRGGKVYQNQLKYTCSTVRAMLSCHEVLAVMM